MAKRDMLFERGEIVEGLLIGQVVAATLVPKLQLGNAPCLRSSASEAWLTILPKLPSKVGGAGASEVSGIPKLELGNEEQRKKTAVSNRRSLVN
jgi:hypothetical protein